MHRDQTVRIRSLFVVAAALVALVMAACQQLPPEERVSQIRSKYEATLNGFVVQQEPIEPMEGEMVEGEGMEAGEAAEGEVAQAEPAEPAAAGAEQAAARGESEAEEPKVDGVLDMEPVPVRQDVLLDIVIRHDSAEKLDGITVDITMADGDMELETWRVWFDTSDLEKGPGIQYTHTLEDVAYQEGYGFNAEIRHPVPPSERQLYEEFESAGP